MIKFLEKFVEFLAMIKIALSPIAVFSLAGAACWFGMNPPWGHIAGIVLGIFGLVAGAILAIYIHRKKGAVEFNSRLMATPELDKKDGD